MEHKLAKVLLASASADEKAIDGDILPRAEKIYDLSPRSVPEMSLYKMLNPLPAIIDDDFTCENPSRRPSIQLALPELRRRSVIEKAPEVSFTEVAAARSSRTERLSILQKVRVQRESSLPETKSSGINIKQHAAPSYPISNVKVPDIILQPTIKNPKLPPTLFEETSNYQVENRYLPIDALKNVSPQHIELQATCKVQVEPKLVVPAIVTQKKKATVIKASNALVQSKKMPSLVMSTPHQPESKSEAPPKAVLAVKSHITIEKCVLTKVDSIHIIDGHSTNSDSSSVSRDSSSSENETFSPISGLSDEPEKSQTVVAESNLKLKQRRQGNVENNQDIQGAQENSQFNINEDHFPEEVLQAHSLRITNNEVEESKPILEILKDTSIIKHKVTSSKKLRHKKILAPIVNALKGLSTVEAIKNETKQNMMKPVHTIWSDHHTEMTSKYERFGRRVSIAERGRRGRGLGRTAPLHWTQVNYETKKIAQAAWNVWLLKKAEEKGAETRQFLMQTHGSDFDLGIEGYVNPNAIKSAGDPDKLQPPTNIKFPMSIPFSDAAVETEDANYSQILPQKVSYSNHQIFDIFSLPIPIVFDKASRVNKITSGIIAKELSNTKSNVKYLIKIHASRDVNNVKSKRMGLIKNSPATSHYRKSRNYMSRAIHPTLEVCSLSLGIIKNDVVVDKSDDDQEERHQRVQTPPDDINSIIAYLFAKYWGAKSFHTRLEVVSSLFSTFFTFKGELQTPYVTIVIPQLNFLEDSNAEVRRSVVKNLASYDYPTDEVLHAVIIAFGRETDESVKSAFMETLNSFGIASRDSFYRLLVKFDMVEDTTAQLRVKINQLDVS